MAIANEGGSNVSILLGNGIGSFNTAVNYTVGSAPQSLATGDFNQDGIVDLVVANYGGRSVSVLLGKGDGTFRIAVNYPTSSNYNPYFVAVGDFNGDGIPDFVAVNYYGASLFLGIGDGTFQTPASLTPGGYDYNSAVVADFNGDGKADLAVAGSSVAVLLGKGDGTFQSPIYYLTSGPYNGIVAGDFNGDGAIDLAVTNNLSGGIIQILPGNGNGTFQSSVTYTGVAQASTGLATGDFNGDGIADLAAVDGISGGNSGVAILLGGALPDLSVSEGHGAGFTQGKWVRRIRLPLATSARYRVRKLSAWWLHSPPFTATAISGNNWTCYLNTLTCTRSDALASGASYSPISVVVNIAPTLTGTVNASATVSGGGDSNTPNNTGYDTAFVRYLPAITMSSSPNPAVLGHAVTLSASVTSAATGKVTFYDGVAVIGVASVSAGQTALVTYSLGGGTHSLFAEYDGDSTYGPTRSSVVSETITEVSANGFNTHHLQFRDGLCRERRGPQPRWQTGCGDYYWKRYQRAAGERRWHLRSSCALHHNGSSPYHILIGDFNGDGNPDVVVSDYYFVYLLLGNGDGTFQPATTTSMSNAQSLAAADFDGDGRLDLAFLSNNIPVILFGNGDGTFQPAVAVANGGTNWTMLLVADMNADGKPDLVGYNGSVNVLLGKGDGTFQNPASYSDSTITNPSSIVAGNFNGDGKTDIAVLYWVGVEVLAGKGDGTLYSLAKSNLGGVPGSYAIAGDFNGDGKLDIAYSAYSFGGFYLELGNGDGYLPSGRGSFAQQLPGTHPGGRLQRRWQAGSGGPKHQHVHPEHLSKQPVFGADDRAQSQWQHHRREIGNLSDFGHQSGIPRPQRDRDRDGQSAVGAECDIHQRYQLALLSEHFDL